jgi:hypothetical protein
LSSAEHANANARQSLAALIPETLIGRSGGSPDLPVGGKYGL